MQTPELVLARYRLTFQATEAIGLPAYAGSAWRGAFGHALKRTVCVTRLNDCSSCMLYRSCAYPYVFETPPPPTSAKMRKYKAAPHPFVLHVEERSVALQPGETTVLGLTLIGRTNAHLGYVLHAFERAGKDGIGKGKGRMSLDEVRQEANPGGAEWRTIYRRDGVLEPVRATAAVSPPRPSGAVKIHFHTPLRLKREGALVRANDLRFSDLFSSLLRRVSMLSYFHGDHPLETEFAALTAAARTVRFVASDLAWRDWTRYSSRQRTTMQLGGIVGMAALDASGLEPFWPYLWLGRFIHAGHNTSMGLGRYSIETASLPFEREHAGGDTIAP